MPSSLSMSFWSITFLGFGAGAGAAGFEAAGSLFLLLLPLLLQWWRLLLDYSPFTPLSSLAAGLSLAATGSLGVAGLSVLSGVVGVVGVPTPATAGTGVVAVAVFLEITRNMTDARPTKRKATQPPTMKIHLGGPL